MGGYNIGEEPILPAGTPGPAFHEGQSLSRARPVALRGPPTSSISVYRQQLIV